MTRAILCSVLATLTLGLGLFTALVQAGNRDRGARLNDWRERASMLEAVRGDMAERILALDSRPLPRDPLALERTKAKNAPRKSAPAHSNPPGDPEVPARAAVIARVEP